MKYPTNKWTKLLVCSLFLPFIICCNNKMAGGPVEAPDDIMANFMSFWRYWNANVRLGVDYTALDQHNRRISKTTFIKELSTGNYLPLRLKSKDRTLEYALYPLSDTAVQTIRSAIAQYGALYAHYYSMEGKALPGFDFVALNGKTYSPRVCRNKIVVINTWFIHCHACRNEMPALNRLVDSLKNNSNVIFLSLARDKKDSLRSFLRKTGFRYPVVPNMSTYISDSLQFHVYPTHMIIDKDGKIACITNDYKQMETMLIKCLGKGQPPI